MQHRDDIQCLTPRHFKIVDYAVKGITAVKIAEMLEMSKVQVSIIMNSPTFKHEFALRRAIYEEKAADGQIEEEDEVLRLLKEGAVKAAEKLVGHVDCSEDGISLRACADVLDRTGYAKKSDKSTEADIVIMVSAEDVDRINKSLEMDSDERSGS